MSKNPIYISKSGGKIYYIRDGSDHSFRVYLNNSSLICKDFIEARLKLKKLEELNDKYLQKSMQGWGKRAQGLNMLVESSAAPYLDNETS